MSPSTSKQALSAEDVAPEATQTVLKDLIAGTAGGWAQVVVGHPFDTLKVRLQTQGPQHQYANALDCLKQTVRNEGVLALYKGVVSPLMGVGVCNAVLFGANGTFRHLIGGGKEQLSIGQYALAGSLSGGVMAWVNCPVELLKVKLQTQFSTAGAPPTYTGVLDCGIKTVRASGLAGLYRGIGITLLREFPSFAVYFGAYESVKIYFKNSNGGAPVGMGQLIIAGGVAGIGAWLPCYPQDVIKSRMQSDSRKGISSLTYAREIYASAGIKGFFRGFGPTMLRAFPANAATFLVYEQARKLMS
ncbi:mitochondrial carrier domain-containing protein [Phlyctochytrium arcticum]|nr:mitochondrial carrier domain-containing protein [Phlyctochytrium arcticum]